MYTPLKRNAEPVDPSVVSILRKAGPLLFELGAVCATPDVLVHLEKHGLRPHALLGLHCHGDYGALDEEDRAVNDEAAISGGRILSAYVVGGELVYVITEAANGLGMRETTTLMFAREY